MRVFAQSRHFLNITPIQLAMILSPLNIYDQATTKENCTTVGNLGELVANKAFLNDLGCHSRKRLTSEILEFVMENRRGPLHILQAASEKHPSIKKLIAEDFPEMRKGGKFHKDVTIYVRSCWKELRLAEKARVSWVPGSSSPKPSPLVGFPPIEEKEESKEWLEIVQAVLQSSHHHGWVHQSSRIATSFDTTLVNVLCNTVVFLERRVPLLANENKMVWTMCEQLGRVIQKHSEGNYRFAFVHEYGNPEDKDGEMNGVVESQENMENELVLQRKGESVKVGIEKDINTLFTVVKRLTGLKEEGELVVSNKSYEGLRLIAIVSAIF